MKLSQVFNVTNFWIFFNFEKASIFYCFFVFSLSMILRSQNPKYTAQKMKFSIHDFFSKCDQIWETAQKMKFSIHDFFSKCDQIWETAQKMKFSIHDFFSKCDQIWETAQKMKFSIHDFFSKCDQIWETSFFVLLWMDIFRETFSPNKSVFGTQSNIYDGSFLWTNS